MWAKIAGGVILYGLAKAYDWCTETDYFSKDPLVKESSKYKDLFAVANRLEKLYGGKAYVGLRIPDADTVSGHTIDIVLVTEGKAVVISVKDIFGIAFASSDSRWNISDPINGIQERIPDPVVETKRKASILESYFNLRGVALPEGYFSCYVVLPKIISSSRRPLPSEVIASERWQQLKPEQKSMFSGCAEGAFRGREEMQRSIHQKFDFILSTAPMWDRLELKGNKYVLGEFLDFNGILVEDIQAWQKIKRSKVSQLIVQKTSEEGSMLNRDYQGEEGSASMREEITLSSSIQVLFRPQNWANKFCRLELSSLVSLSLSI